ncbi:DUF222 domain-containing protein [Kribbella sp. NPDC058245]|uniref:HNH endonuclease signature motif containing protein n=1 Tax=Kribbella sp. NPDC058245 TaxID=3346399 RepID=UPI0036EAA8B0
MEILAMRPVWMQSGSELLSTLDTLESVDALVKTLKLQVIGHLDEMGTAQEFGAHDTVELVSQRYRLNPADVRKDVTFSGALGKYPAVTAALPDPTDPSRPAVLDPALAKVIVTTLEKAPASVPVDQLEVAEEQMVEAARISNPRELTKFGLEVLARLDTDGAEPAEDEARAKESLRVRQVEGGVKFSGMLAGADGETLITQIHALSKPHKTVDGERDPRSLEVRQVDAFKTILEAAAGNPDYPGVPHITVTIDFNDLKASVGIATEAATTNTPTPTTTSGAGASGAAGTTDPVGVLGSSGTGGELVFGGNLSASAVRLLACDAAILPIVLGGDSQPLDVGTEQRFVNRYIRRALNKRDKGCVVCKAPPSMCHAHHLTHWADGGPTSMRNLALLCARHHRAVHAGQWRVSITSAGVVQVTRPAWADPSPTDPASLAAVVAWVTPADSVNDSTAKAPTSNVSTVNASASASSAGASTANAANAAGVGVWTPGTGGASAGSASGSDTGGAGRASVSSDPMDWPPSRLPAATTLPSPEVAAAREAFRARLGTLDRDPWATDATTGAGP